MSKLTVPAAKALINKGLPAFCRAFAAGTVNFDKNNHNNYQNNEDVFPRFSRGCSRFFQRELTPKVPKTTKLTFVFVSFDCETNKKYWGDFFLDFQGAAAAFSGKN